jgi:hypothetical protein
MSDRHGESVSRDSDDTPRRDAKDLQQELKREELEGRDGIGDVAENRNLTGSSTWSTLPESSRAGSAETDVTPRAARAAADVGDEDRRRVAGQIAARLRARGIRLDGRESGEELVSILEAVERFEAIVAARGGDLMVDQPVGAGRPISPDIADFVLPPRAASQSPADFIASITEAEARARKAGSDA